ncbi:MAG: CoA transferase, partial [Fimbriimonadaceae bacterium]|nr:CoA transferase [Alphaproteobacteria bacterium]
LNYIGDTGLLSLSMGPDGSPTLPPALISDIGGGSMPAVINVLLALLSRDKTGEGTHIDIAMSDAMFMFGYWALAEGLTQNNWPQSGSGLLTGGSPRYHIYPTSDGRHVAAAPLEQRFWTVFCDLIGLADNLRNDLIDPAKTTEAVARIIAAQSSDFWRNKFSGQDCCCTIVATMEEAYNDPHFNARGLFAQKIENGQGETVPAAVVAVAPQFRHASNEPINAPALGENNEEILGSS